MEIAEVIEGILLGFFKLEHTVKHCVSDVETLAENIEKGVYYIKDLENGFSVSDIAEAFMYFKDAVKEIPVAIKDCTDIQHLE